MPQSQATGTHESPVVEVAFPIPVRREFAYRVPAGWKLPPVIGMRVRAPLGGKDEVGVIVAIGSDVSPTVALKELLRPVDPDRILPAVVVELCRWVAEYYYASWGEVLAAAAGPASRDAEQLLQLSASLWDGTEPRVTPSERALLAGLRSRRARSWTSLRRGLTGRAAQERTLNGLIARGLIETEWVARQPAIPRDGVVFGARKPAPPDLPEELRTPLTWLADSDRSHTIRQLATRLPGGARALRGLIENQCLEWSPLARPSASASDIDAEPLVGDLNDAQRDAAARIDAALSKKEFTTQVLWGPTGSGKTAVYCEAIRRTWALGRKALYLVPEIALASQLIERLAVSLGERPAVWHSSLSASERYWIAQQVAAGQYRLVIGARSAVFAPIDPLGLIVVDEEHADAYKQSSPSPRYQARDTAVVRARLSNAVCLLGSATPAVETIHNVETGKYELLRLHHRINRRPMPEIETVDLRTEEKTVGDWWLSPQMVEGLTATLTAGRKAIVFINRRGHSTVVACRSCAHTETCTECGLTLTYHARDRSCRCHLCGYVKRAENTCPKCGSADFLFRGVGTQKIEEALATLATEVRLVRLDADTASQRGVTEDALVGFASGRYNLLIGTQMVTKGLNIADVGLVGVIWADQQMAFPDFRAEERTFQLLTQVAGRAGRGDGEGPSRVLIQTFHPDHPLIRLAATHDVEGFFARELPLRRGLHYPPYAHLILLHCRGTSEQAARDCGAMFVRYWHDATPDTKSSRTRILGPAPAGRVRRGTQYTYHVLIKTSQVRRVCAVIGQFEQTFAPDLRRRGMAITVDVDPYDFL